jgi:hypothetical protein
MNEILKMTNPITFSKEDEKVKLYDFNEMNELEKHVGYDFQDKTLLV